MTDDLFADPFAAPSLKTELWLKAHIRRCEVNGAIAMIARRGDSDAGAVYLKLYKLGEGFAVLSKARNGHGNPIWLRATGKDWLAEFEVEDYLRKQAKFDPDFWVLEIEDREGRAFVDEPIENV